MTKELDPQGTNSCWFMLGRSFEGHDECRFGSVDCVRALGLIWSWLGFLLAGVRISMIAAHWLQTYLSCLVRNSNFTLPSWFVVKGVSAGVSLAISDAWLEKPLVLI